MRAPDTTSGVFPPHGVGRAAFEPLHEGGNRQCGWVGDEQAYMVLGGRCRFDAMGVPQRHAVAG
jgi:hypothetical protein